MSQEGRYASPEAARRAVTDRLRAAALTSPWSLPDLQRQYAYDRLVERLYRIDSSWVVKGATALLARRVAVRHTLDIDLYRAGAIADADRLLREAATMDLGDWVRFELGPSAAIRAGGAQARRIGVAAFIGGRPWTQFKVDVVAAGIVLSGTPDEVSPLTDGDLAVGERTLWRAYPLADHVADKLHGILERTGTRPSTRFKDLVDLVAIANRCVLAADATLRALAHESARRGVRLPLRLEAPDRRLWTAGYAAIARSAVGLTATTLDDALGVVAPLADPLLAGTAEGRWDPDGRRWR